MLRKVGTAVVRSGGQTCDRPRARNPWGWAWENPPAAFAPTPVGGGFTPETWRAGQDADRKQEFQFREAGFGRPCRNWLQRSLCGIRAILQGKFRKRAETGHNWTLRGPA